MVAATGVGGKLKLVFGKGAVADGQPVICCVVLLSAASFFQPSPARKEKREREG